MSLAMLEFVLAGLIAGGVCAQQSGGPAPQASSATKPAETVSPAPDKKVVIKVGDDQVTVADLDFLVGNLGPEAQQAMLRQGRRPLAEQYALILVFSQQAVIDHLDSSPEFRRHMALQRMQRLAQAEYDSLVRQASASPDEINKYYSAHQGEFEEAQARQVVIRTKAQGAKEGTPGLPLQEARARADSIRKALATAGDAKQVVKDFQVPNEVLVEAQPRTFRHGQLPADMDKTVFQLKDGGVTEPLETPQALVLFQLVGRRTPELKEVSGEIDNAIRGQKVEAAVAELKKKSSIWMDEDYFKSPLPTPPVLPPQPAADKPPR